MKLCKLIFDDECFLTQEERDIEIENITCEVKKSDADTLLFILNESALNDFINSKASVKAIVFDQKAELPSKKLGRKVKIFKTENVRKLFSFAYSRFCDIDYSRIKFIGITGTNGKTSIASFITKVLEDNGHKVGFIGTGKIILDGAVISDEEYSMTTPDPWVLYPTIKLMEDAGCDIIVMEVSSHALALDKTSPIHFDYAVFSNLGAEHLDFHKNMEQYFLSKKKLFAQCSVGVFNIDDSYGRRACREFEKRKISVGILWQGDVWATHIVNKGFDGTEYMYRDHSFLFKMKLQLAGIHNIYNSMLAAAVCIDFGIKPCDVKHSLGVISTLPGRFEIIKSDITVIIDYAHTPAAYESLLKEIVRAKLPAEKLITVFGCGGERDKEKRPLIAKIAERYSDEIYVTSDNPRSEPPERIIKDITAGFVGSGYKIITERENAIYEAILSAQSGSIVAIIGKGAEKYSIDSTGYHTFDEKAIITSAIERRGVIKSI